MSTVKQGAVALLIATLLGITGCGTPGAPLPPSLHLPERVGDLSATRTGSQVSLAWIMPKRTTDRVLLKDDVPVGICWSEGNSQCVAAGGKSFAPATPASFLATLPDSLATGTPRPVSYFVELKNKNGKSAGLSNAAVVLAGQAPAPVTGLAAEVRKQGVVLRWNAADPQEAIRLRRTLLNPPASKPKEGLLAPAEEPVLLDLRVEHDGGVAIDKEIRFGSSYEYRAQRIASVASDGKSIDLEGEFSPPLRVVAQDVFPTSAPAGLAAVATAATDGSPASIDLSWQPVAESDIAAYRVYRREAQSEWRRVSGDQPVVGPAFHDADVQAGHTYFYAVTAVDTRGNESPRSAEASDTVPKP
jgi:hypothetical protein